MARRCRAALFAVLLTSLAAPLQAQGLLLDAGTEGPVRLPRPVWPPRPEPRPERPESSYRIESIEVNAKLADAVAKVQVSQTFVNTGSGQIEATFVFPLPYDGAVDQLTLLVDGREYAAKLLPKDEARRRYEEIVRANRDPALLEWVGAGMFQTSVFPIPAGAKRTVTLRYSQICRKASGLTDFHFPLKAARYSNAPLETLEVRVAIDSSADVNNVYSPTHNVKIDHVDDRHVTVAFSDKNTICTDDFRLLFDAKDESVAASVISYRPQEDEPGYFLLLASPRLAESQDKPSPKTVVLAIDRSGSMSGEKMEQAKAAAKFVINNLRRGDTFNIVAYDSEIEAFRTELERFSDKTRAAAIGFVNGLFAGGSTNIDGALERSLEMLNDVERPSYVLFLTDGLPTVGESNEAKIVANSKQSNGVRARIFPFGVGYDVNSRLLDRLAREHRGQSEYVRPSEDIETAVSNLYRRIESPVMTDVRLTIDVEDARESDGPVVNRVYPAGEFDLFAGDQAVIVGRYRAAGDAKVKLVGTLHGENESFAFPAKFVKHSDDDTNAFVAKLWATRRVGEIIDDLDLKGQNEELVKELVDLATEHGILTPYTSFMAEENGGPRDRAGQISSASDRLRRLEEAEGEFGFLQREAKSGYQLASRPPAATTGGAVVAETAAAAPLADASGRGVAYYNAEKDQHIVTHNVITVGRKTFFRRGERWIDSAVDEEEEKSARRIERYSREYFDLVDRYGKHVAQYLAIEDPVVVELDGEVYIW